MPDGFSRDVTAIQREFVIACSRRALALTNRNNALADAQRADDAVLKFEWHVELCERQINGLLDELGRARRADALVAE